METVGLGPQYRKLNEGES